MINTNINNRVISFMRSFTQGTRADAKIMISIYHKGMLNKLFITQQALDLISLKHVYESS